MSRRWIAGLLAAAMVVTMLLPVSAFAEELSTVDSTVVGGLSEQETDGSDVTAEQPAEEGFGTDEEASGQENSDETADMAKNAGTEEAIATLAAVYNESGKQDSNTTAVAEVNGIPCITLQDVVQKIAELAQAGTEVTVSLQQDVELHETMIISAGWNVTLDLNGRTVTLPGVEDRKIKNEGNLTIRDSVGTGVLKNIEEGSYGLIDNYGTLTILSGTFENNGRASGAAIKNRLNATLLSIKGGVFKNLVEDEGGNLNGYATAANALVASEAPLVVTGGEFSSVAWYTPAFKIFNGGTTEISNVDVTTYKAGGIEVSGGNDPVYLSNCTFRVSDMNSYYANAVAVSNGGSVYINGGSYEGYKYAAYIYNSGGDITINAGTFVAETVLRADSTSKPWGAKIVVTGGNFDGDFNIGNSNASLTVSGGTFDRKLDEKYLADGFEMKQNEDGTFTTIESMAGEGTASAPYIISNLDQLKLFRDKVNGGENTAGKFYKLAADIDLAGEEWMPIGGTNTNIKFEGTFDGAGHTISNLKITRGIENISQNNQVGFFGACTSSAKLQNFTIKNVDVTGGLNVAAVLGGTGGSEAAISNVHVIGNVKISADSYVGGILGKGYSKVTGCSVEGDGTASSYVTGSYVYVGGIVGFMGEGSMITSECTVKNITISGKFNGIGGINGILHYGNTIRDCNLENVVVWQTTDPSEDNGKVYVGAFAGCYLDNNGKNIPTVENCDFEGILYSGRNKADVTGPERSVGEVWYGTDYPCTLNLSNCTVVRTAPAPTPGQSGSNQDDEDNSAPVPTPTPVATPVPTATARPTTVVSHSKPTATPAATAQVPTGDPVVAATQVEATVAENTAVVTVDSKQLTNTVNQVISEAKASDGAPVVKVEVAGAAEATAIEVTLPVQALDTLAKEPGATLTVTSDVAEVTFDTTALTSIAGQADEEIVLVVTPVAQEDMSDAQAEKVNGYPTFELTLQSGGKIISDFNRGEATVTLPYALAEGQQAEGVVVWYVEDNGNTTVCETAYDSQAQKVTFVTPHFSRYAIAYDETLVADQTGAELPVAQEPATQEPAQEGGISLPMVIGIAVIVILVMVFAGRIFFAKKDSDRY